MSIKGLIKKLYKSYRYHSKNNNTDMENTIYKIYSDFQAEYDKLIKELEGEIASLRIDLPRLEHFDDRYPVMQKIEGLQTALNKIKEAD
jgi:hypothetical protein